MHKTAIAATIGVIILAAAAAWYFNQAETLVETVAGPEPVVIQETSKPIVQPPEVKQVIAPPQPEPGEPPLPELGLSDEFMLSTLSGLLNPELSSLIVSDNIIRRIVTTVDNLTNRQLPKNIVALHPAESQFMVMEQSGKLFIHPQNYRRYDKYITFIQYINPESLAYSYAKLYPLFQQAYENLGYPNRYFNDRVLQVIDHLQATPEIADPIPLVRPKVFYQFADPKLEQSSIGQRIMLRIGSTHRQQVKQQLTTLKQAIQQHMREQQQQP